MKQQDITMEESFIWLLHIYLAGLTFSLPARSLSLSLPLFLSLPG